MEARAIDRPFPDINIQTRTLEHYLLACLIMAIYGTQVCPFIESLSLAELAPLLTFIMVIQLVLRQWLHQRFILPARPQTQAGRIFQLELLLFICSAMLLTFYNALVHHFPIASGLKMMLGFAALGFFIAVDLTLQHERKLAERLPLADQPIDFENNYFPLTRKLTLVASSCVIFIMGIVFLVINKDLEWLIQTGQAMPLGEARGAILFEVGFIVVIFIGYLLTIIQSYTRNLHLFFNTENSALIDATSGNLTSVVPVSTNDEFGIMAKHTNLMIEGLRNLTAELQTTRDVTILSLASLAETRDNETGAHLLRTQRYVRALAEQLQDHPGFAHYLDEETIELLFKSAPLHDIGKVGIPDHILLKPGALTAEEFEIMKRHTTLGGQALQVAEGHLGSNSFLQLARDIATCHHEKWDGSGYPQGLQGEQIPIAGRLMALADVYDALISKRVYKPAFSHDKAAAIILEGKGRHFDPDVVAAFQQAEQRFLDIASAYRDDSYDRT